MCSGRLNLVFLSEPVLVGREGELEELQCSLDSALLGKGKTVFISGEAGSGKTRLTNEFLNIARKRDITVLFGWCLSNTTLPFFPFIEAFGSEVMSRGGETMLSQPTGLKSWLSESYFLGKREKSRIVVPEVWKDQVFTAIARELLYLSSVKPLILVLEDMHWADSASLALLHYISRTVVGEKILVLVTFRSEEIGRDAEGRLHPLAKTVNLMSREGLFREVQLANLSQEHVRGLAESMLRGKVNSKLVKRLMKESRGNPLFAVEFLRMLFDQGNLVWEKDQWQLPVERLGLPSKVKGVIMQRIGTLRQDQRRVLDVASVIGEKFNPDLIAGVLSKDPMEILEVLNGILKSTSLVSVSENLYMFDHPKFQEVLYEEISAPLKRVYHERVAEQIENASKNAEEIQFSDLAYHYVHSGNKEKSVKYSLAAGQDALARFSNKEAIKHFRYVLETLAETDEFAVERSAALEGLGDAYYGDCMFEEALKTFERLANSAADAVRLRAYRKALDVAWFIADPSRMLRLVEEAEQYAVLDRLERVRVLMNKGRAYFKLGDFEASLRAHEEGLQIAKEECSLPDLARSIGMTGGQRIMCGCDIKKGLGEMQRSVSLCQELSDIRHELTGKEIRHIFFVSFGLFKEMDDEFNYILNIGEKIGAFNILAGTSVIMSDRFESSGDFEQAIALSLKALEYSRKTDIKSLEPRIFGNLVRQYARIGDLEKADHYFDLLMKIPSKILSVSPNAPWVAMAEAAIFAAKGQWKEADASFHKAFELSRKGISQHLNLEFSPVFRQIYIWALELQGRTEEAEIQRKLVQETMAKTDQMFAHADLQADLVMKKRIIVDEEVDLRLDLVNVGRGSVSVIKIDGLVHSDKFKVVDFPSYCCLQNGDLEMNGREIGAFEVDPVKLVVKAVETGVFTLEPSVVYVDDLGETKTCRPQPVQIIVGPRIAQPMEEVVVETEPAELVFRSEAAQRAFDFLVKAFVEDYFHRRFPVERAGWRTMMDIVNQANVSRYSMYGSSDHRGIVTRELKNLDVVEVRFFLGERGRGGKILKLRVSYEKEVVNSILIKVSKKV
jgi:tetratricopeptide (TPR) repeat protein